MNPGYRGRIAPARIPISFSRWYAPLGAVLGAGRRRSWLSVSDDEITVRMGWAFRATVPRSHVVSVVPHPPIRYAVGVHVVRRGDWIVNGTTQGIVDLRIDPPVRARAVGFPIHLRRLRVSVESPDELVDALASERAA